jgi:hypothetical protein
MPSLFDLPTISIDRSYLLVLLISATALVGYCIYRLRGGGRRHRRRK